MATALPDHLGGSAERIAGVVDEPENGVLEVEPL
jgi:hypothetical protein